MTDLTPIYSETGIPAYATENDYVDNWGDCVPATSGGIQFTTDHFTAGKKVHYAEENPTFQALAARDAKLGFKLDQMIEHIGTKGSMFVYAIMWNDFLQKWNAVTPATLVSGVNLEDLGDVPTCIAGEMLRYNGLAWDHARIGVFMRDSTYGAILTDLKDVIAAPTANSFLRRNPTNTGYIFDTLSSVINHNIGSAVHSDTVISGMGRGDLIGWDTVSSKWKNFKRGVADLVQVGADITGAVDATSFITAALTAGDNSIELSKGLYYMVDLTIGSTGTSKDYSIDGVGRPTVKSVTTTGLSQFGLKLSGSIDTALIRSLVFKDLGSGAATNLFWINLTAGGTYNDIVIEDCTFIGRGSAPNFSLIKLDGTGVVGKHFITFKNCVFKDISFDFSTVTADTIVIFDNCKYNDVYKIQFSGTIVLKFISTIGFFTTTGNIQLNITKVEFNNTELNLGTGTSNLIIIGDTDCFISSSNITCYGLTFSSTSTYKTIHYLNSTFTATYLTYVKANIDTVNSDVYGHILHQPSNPADDYKACVILNNSGTVRPDYYDYNTLTIFQAPEFIKGTRGYGVFGFLSGIMTIAGNIAFSPQTIIFDRGESVFPYGGSSNVAGFMDGIPFIPSGTPIYAAGKFSKLPNVQNKGGFIRVRYHLEARASNVPSIATLDQFCIFVQSDIDTTDRTYQLSGRFYEQNKVRFSGVLEIPQDFFSSYFYIKAMYADVDPTHAVTLTNSYVYNVLVDGL